jgi:RHS repeat-associated protein
VVEKYSYSVFGQTTIKDGSDNVLIQSAIGNRYGFTGREYDSESGLYFYRSRYYSPELGRFLQTDPIGYFDSNNLYQYCGNNSINFTDPLGLCKGEDNTPDWDIDFDIIFNNLEEISNALVMNPMSDGTPLPFDTGAGLVGLGIAKARKVVIGETAKRVAKKALEIGAKYYNPVKDASKIGLGKAMRNNYQWLWRKVKQGYKIIDIGIDKARSNRGIFYEAEKRWLELWD